MATDNRYVEFEDGEGLSHTDLNAGRDYSRMLEGDFKLGALFQRSAPQDFQTPYPARAAVLAHGLSGVPLPSGTNLTIDNTAGLISQYTSLSSPDSATPRLLSYWVDADELQTTLSAGDATYPRIDLIEIALDLEDETTTVDFQDAATGVVTSGTGTVRKRVRLTKVVIPGTPAAVPSLPATSAGAAAWCYVWVPATHATVFTDLHVWDVRYPLGFDRLFVPPQAIVPAVTLSFWPIDNGPGSPRTSGAASELMYAFVPSIDPGRRLLTAYVHADANVDLTLYSVDLNSGAATTVVSTQTNVLTLSIPAGAAGNSATKPGALWLSGLAHADPYLFGNQSAKVLRLGIESRGAGTNVYGVSFEIAGTV